MPAPPEKTEHAEREKWRPGGPIQTVKALSRAFRSSGIGAEIHARLREENFRRYVLKTDGVVLGAEIGALDYMGYWPEWLAADTAAWWETSSWIEKLDLLLLLTTRGRGKVEIPGGGFRELPPA